MNTMTELETQLLQALRDSSKHSEEQIGKLATLIDQQGKQIAALSRQLEVDRAYIKTVSEQFKRVMNDYAMVTEACTVLRQSL